MPPDSHARKGKQGFQCWQCSRSAQAHEPLLACDPHTARSDSYEPVRRKLMQAASTATVLPSPHAITTPF